MKPFKVQSILAASKKRVLNARKDKPDFRDLWYEPALIPLKRTVDNRDKATVRDQGEDGACTGFGLAAVIDILGKHSTDKTESVSTRMLYEMAKRHDEWPGRDYEGSSCRGALRGWKNMGVCEETVWPYDPKKPGDLTIERAKAAKATTLGAYYRLRPDVNHYHVALNEVGAVYVSATIHEGWEKPTKPNKSGKQSILSIPTISLSSESTGGHAFAIVGYNDQGFIVQNSWGPSWGGEGFALWLYQDWAETIVDGWVFRMAVPTPKTFGLVAKANSEKESTFQLFGPKRHEIAGHFVHLDDGKLKSKGDYWSTLDDLEQTAQLIAKGKYPHLVLYAHGGLNSSKACARRIVGLKDGFLRNGIYPIHFMYETGLGETIKDLLFRTEANLKAQGGTGESWDAYLEDKVRKPGTALWDEMKRDARLPFEATAKLKGDGFLVIQKFAEILKGSGTKIHLVGHSAGSILLGHLLAALDELNHPNLIQSLSLMAPACTVNFFQEHYRPRIKAKSQNKINIPSMDVYALSDELEQADNVALAYRKSLLYLVSNAFERAEEVPLLGMQNHAKKIPPQQGLSIQFSEGKDSGGKVTRSESHGGFDNDLYTLNSVLKRILGKSPEKPFVEKEMKGF